MPYDSSLFCLIHVRIHRHSARRWHGRNTALEELSSTDCKAAFERARLQHSSDADYARQFNTNDEIQATQRAARKTLSGTPDFNTAIKATATARIFFLPAV